MLQSGRGAGRRRGVAGAVRDSVVVGLVHTPRMRIIAMSISGLSLRTSTRTQATHPTIPTASRPSVLAEPQPQLVVSEMAISTHTKPVVISADASQLTRPGRRTGDSGTNRHVARAAITVTTSGIQYSQ